MSLWKFVIRLILALYVQSNIGMCSDTSNITATPGQSLTLRCTYFHSTEWYVTVDGFKRLAALCRYGGICNNYHPEIYFSTNKKKSLYSGFSLKAKVNYLQIFEVPPKITKVECDNFNWNIAVHGNQRPVKLLANNSTGSLEVKLGNIVNFTCITDTVPEYPLILYEDETIITNTTSNNITYGLTVVKTDSFLVTCSMKLVTETVLVTVEDCQVDFKVNSQIELDVAPNSPLVFVCTTGPCCASKMSLTIRESGEVLDTAQCLDYIYHVRTFSECGKQFVLGCHLAEDNTTKEEVRVNVFQCPKLNLIINNMIEDEVEICYGYTAFISCSYKGAVLTNLLQMYWLQGHYKADLNSTVGNRITATVPDYLLTDVTHYYTDNLVGCKLDGAYDSIVETKVIMKECYRSTENPQNTSQQSKSVVIGVSLGAGVLVFLIIYILVLCYTRAKYTSRLRERQTTTHLPTSLHLDNGQTVESPSLSRANVTDNSVQTGLQSSISSCPDLSTLPPAYEDVVHVYKHNNQSVTEYIPGNQV